MGCCEADFLYPCIGCRSEVCHWHWIETDDEDYFCEGCFNNLMEQGCFVCKLPIIDRHINTLLNKDYELVPIHTRCLKT